MRTFLDHLFVAVTSFHDLSSSVSLPI